MLGDMGRVACQPGWPVQLFFASNILTVKRLRQNPGLSFAIALSVLLHAGLLALRFASPIAVQHEPPDKALEIILVNARHDKQPLQAEALAQANLDGGGNASEGRAKSPLPSQQQSREGESMTAAERRIRQLEQQQREILAQAQAAKHTVASAPVGPPPAEPANTDQATEAARQLARREAEIAKRIEEYNKRPRKTHISPRTREVGYALYFDAVRQKIEKIGTLNFPRQNGEKLYGELVLSISIFQDGTLYGADGEGGIVTERSSGNPALDAAAAQIVLRAAPFDAFARTMRSADKNDVWIMTTSFKFTRDDALEAGMLAGEN